jgi:hypothetical protein
MDSNCMLRNGKKIEEDFRGRQPEPETGKYGYRTEAEIPWHGRLAHVFGLPYGSKTWAGRPCYGIFGSAPLRADNSLILASGYWLPTSSFIVLQDQPISAAIPTEATSRPEIMRRRGN